MPTSETGANALITLEQEKILEWLQVEVCSNDFVPPFDKHRDSVSNESNLGFSSVQISELTSSSS